MSSTVEGKLHVANDVIVDMIGNAALECYGVVGMTSANPSEGIVDGIASILPSSRLRRGIIVLPSDQGVNIDLFVVVEYGVNISTVCHNLIDRVSYVLTEYAQVPAGKINVHVQDVRMKK